ncbi:Gfo/Idh/MocA family oxidoreductase [Rhodobacterales bacterium HKCCE2091]|nr:Gfo/Idh/MocA family oxidoreductase [Rhodobacterales bacterium HKCCE2091]
MNRVAALIGTGMVARTHLLAIRDTPGLTLGAVVARHYDSAERFADLAEAETGHRPEVMDDAHDVAAAHRIDFAIVVTPPDARLGIIRPLAAATKPVLLEKPVARDLEEATELVELCEKANIPLGIVFQTRMRAASRKAAEMVASGEFGPLGLVEISVPWWREQKYYDEPGRGSYARDGGGVLISQAIHTIDLALSLTGPVSEVTAMTATTRFHSMEAEDVAAAGLTFENGAVGWLTASTASYPGGPEMITLHFDRATLRLGEGVLRVSWRDGREDTFGAAATTGGGADPMAFTHDWHKDILADFLDCLDTGRPPLVTGREALKAHALIDAIVTSARRGHAMPVETP